MEKKTYRAASHSSLLSLYVYEILRQYSNKEHPLSGSQLKEMLKELADFEIGEENRRIIPLHVRGLVEHLPGIIVETKAVNSGTVKWYYDGSKVRHKTILAHADYSALEIQFLVDMLASAQVLSEDTTEKMQNKLLSLLNVWDREGVRPPNEQFHVLKHENVRLQDLKRKLENAYDNSKAVAVTYEQDANETTLPPCLVHALYEDERGEVYVFLSSDGNEYKVPLVQITGVKERGFQKADRAEKIEDGLSERGIWNDSTQSLDITLEALFCNLRQIAKSIQEKRYLRFKQFKSALFDPNMEMPTRTVIPVKTEFRDGKYYLVAVEKHEGDYSVAYVRIDQIESVRLGRSLSERDQSNLNADEILAKDSQYSDKTTKIKVKFTIKKQDVLLAWDAFGADVYAEQDASPLESTSAVRAKIAKADPEFFYEALIGYREGEEVSELTVEATREEAIRWGLEYADTVEIKEPLSLRLQVQALAETLRTRYSKDREDIFERQYRDVLLGKEPLRLGGKNPKDQEIFKRIQNENAYAEVASLLLEGESLPWEDMAKFKNVTLLRIMTDQIKHFSFLDYYKKLESLALIGTKINDGEALTKLPVLRTLFIHKNHLKSYDFLKRMKLSVLYLGDNRADDYAALYELENVTMVIEEDVLLGLDVKRLVYDGGDCMVYRWIDDGYNSSLPAHHPINEKIFCV